MPALRQKVRLEYEVDGELKELVVEYNAFDVRAWEAQSGQSALVEKTSYSMLTWMAHHAAVRTGALDGQLKDYAKFDESCINVEGVREDPTQPPAKATRKPRGGSSSAA